MRCRPHDHVHCDVLCHRSDCSRSLISALAIDRYLSFTLLELGFVVTGLIIVAIEDATGTDFSQEIYLIARNTTIALEQNNTIANITQFFPDECDAVRFYLKESLPSIFLLFVNPVFHAKIPPVCPSFVCQRTRRCRPDLSTAPVIVWRTTSTNSFSSTSSSPSSSPSCEPILSCRFLSWTLLFRAHCVSPFFPSIFLRCVPSGFDVGICS